MDRLSDCILLPILYRCPSATFLARRLQNKSHNLRKWISVRRPNQHLDQYKNLDSLSVNQVTSTMELVILSQLTSLRFKNVDCGLVRLSLREKCPNLTSLTCVHVSGGFTDNILSSIPQSVTRLVLPRARVYQDPGYTWITMDSLRRELPVLLECTLLTYHFDSSMKHIACSIPEGVPVTIASTSMEHLALSPVRHPSIQDVDSIQPRILTLQCPTLVSLDIEMQITSDTMENILSCSHLTHLTIMPCPAIMNRLNQLKIQSLIFHCDYGHQGYDNINTSDLPVTLTHLEIQECCRDLIFEPATLTRLVSLKCRSLRGPLPTSLRKIVCSDSIHSDVSNIPLQELIVVIEGRLTQLTLPDSLTSFDCYCSEDDTVLPTHLPSRLRRLVLGDASRVPETWSFSKIQYVDCGEAAMNTRQEAEMPRRRKLVAIFQSN